MSAPSFRRNSRAKAERMAAARQLIDQGAVICVYWSPFNPRARRPGKSPIPYSALDPSLDGSRNECRTIDQVEQFLDFDPMANLALFNVAQADADTDHAARFAANLGVTREDRNWIIRTRRGWRALYSLPSIELTNSVKLGCRCGVPKPNGQSTSIDECHGRHEHGATVELDLLVRSPALVPPSIHPAGVPYRWVGENTPDHISFQDLAQPPDDLLELWKELGARPALPPRPALAQGRSTVDAVESALAGANQRGRLPSPGPSGWIPTNCPFTAAHKHGDRESSFSYLPPSARDPGAWFCHAGCGSGSIRSLAERLGLQVTTARRAGRGGFTTETRF